MKKIIYALLPLLMFFSCKKSSDSHVKSTTNTTDPPAPTATTLSFSGYTWTIKDSGTGTLGPGPNNWKAANAYVDGKGYLHLKITKVGTKWYCAEIQSTQTFGSGTYQFWVKGRLDKLDTNAILGLFNYSGTDDIDEVDIEYGTFGGTTTNSGFTVYPTASVGGPNWHDGFTTTLSDSLTTQRYTRNGTSSVFFQELSGYTDGDTPVIDTATCTNPPHSISAVAMPVYINYWLYKGHSPVSDVPSEIVIQSFKFTEQ